DVDVVCARDGGEQPAQTVDAVRIHRLPARRRRGGKFRYAFEYVSFTMMAFLSVTSLWIRRRHNAVYVIGIPNFLVFAALVPRLGGARVLLDMRDPLPEFFEAKYKLSERDPLVRGLLAEERISARFASRVVTVHHTMATLYERSVPAAKIGVVMNAPDPRVFAVDSGARRDPGDRTMLYAGTVASRYGVDLAVRALASLRDEIPALRLRIVGDGDLVPALRAIAHEEGLEDRVSFDGPVPLEAIPRIVQESWIGVQPNRDDPLMRYSLSTKVLEWCLLGLPVVAGETRPLLELFTKDELLFHAPEDLEGMCDRIREANADPAALAERAIRARAAAGRISFETEAAALLRLVAGDRSR
ncbi:MAG TPA: glycosyltransferase, partial [Actinomycetota bacterium]|nr:glycosyltransferase [Actinomycetota bacterium]